MGNIDIQIDKLRKEERIEFNKILEDKLYNRDWCRQNGIDYSNPNIRQVKVKVYNWMYNMGFFKF